MANKYLTNWEPQLPLPLLPPEKFLEFTRIQKLDTAWVHLFGVYHVARAVPGAGALIDEEMEAKTEAIKAGVERKLVPLTLPTTTHPKSCSPCWGCHSVGTWLQSRAS